MNNNKVTINPTTAEKPTTKGKTPKKQKPQNKARKNKDGRSKSKTSFWEQIETNIKLNTDTGKYQVTLYDGERRGYKNVETLQEARQLLIEYGAKRIRGGGYKLTPETFTEYAENFLGTCTLKASTKDGYKAILSRIKRAPIGRLKIRDIIPRDIEIYKKSLMDEGHLGRNTINKHINFISTVFEDTVKNGIKDSNPARAITRLTKNSYHGQALTAKQVNDLIETLETETEGIDGLTLKTAVYFHAICIAICRNVQDTLYCVSQHKDIGREIIALSVEFPHIFGFVRKI